MAPAAAADIEEGCPIPGTHRRLAAAHRLWHQTLKAYGNPDAFRTNLNATIQELRNITFILQKEHRKVPNFDTWYPPHREALRRDSLARWVVESRNHVVKEGDLETHSRAVVTLVDGYVERPSLVMEVPPGSTARKIAAAVASKVPDGVRDAYLMVERRWEVQDLPGRELLEVLAACYSTMEALVADAHRVAGSDYVAAECSAVRGHPLSRVRSCMGVAREHRTARIELGSNAFTNIRRRRAKRTPEVLKYAKERYGELPDKTALRTGDYPTKARELHKVARAIIKADPLAIAVHLYRNGDLVHLAMLAPVDRTAKYALWRAVAEAVDAFDADAVITNVESWRYSPDEPDVRDECVQTYYEGADGAALEITSVFKREGEGVVLDPAMEVSNPDGVNFLEPIRVVWRKRGART